MIRFGDAVQVVNKTTKEQGLTRSIGEVGRGPFTKNSEGKSVKMVYYKVEGPRYIGVLFEKQDVVKLWKKTTIKRSKT